ncbi:hypothetical protein HMPREF1392_00064 [Helicobacter pylori GAM101Biv]|nr:hypothetical protein HMPREF1392_00064 [Helicobacter pylori GAM101Biv]
MHWCKIPSNSEIPPAIEIPKWVLKILLFLPNAMSATNSPLKEIKNHPIRCLGINNQATALLLLTAVMTRSEKKYTLEDAKCRPYSLKTNF